MPPKTHVSSTAVHSLYCTLPIVINATSSSPNATLLRFSELCSSGERAMHSAGLVQGGRMLTHRARRVAAMPKRASIDHDETQ
eukprot:9254226-Pyramimonas_sp.AAC.1